MTHTCPGQTWPDHQPWDPRPCGQPTNLHLCWDCIKRLHALLRGLTADLDELRTQLARQARHEPAAGSANTGDVWPDEDLTYRLTATPMAIDTRASDVLADTRSVLVGWTRVACETAGDWPADTETAMLRRLRRADWHTHPAADELLDELRWLHAQVVSCIETPAARRYLGPCGAERDDGTECDGDVYAIGTRVRCIDCGAAHSRDDRIAWVASIADGLLVNAADASAALTGWGITVKAQAVYDWARRGRLANHGHDRNGHPVYVLSEVRELAVETNARADRRAAMALERARRGQGATQLGRVDPSCTRGISTV